MKHGNDEGEEGAGGLEDVYNELGEVRPCDCGGVHLAMGPLTLHFAHEDVDALFELVCAAKQMADLRPPSEAAAGAAKGPDDDQLPVPDASAGDAKPAKKRRNGKAKSQSLLH